jgi:hypothetical protein
VVWSVRAISTTPITFPWESITSPLWSGVSVRSIELAAGDGGERDYGLRPLNLEEERMRRFNTSTAALGVAMTALFVALGGPAWALKQIGVTRIKNGSITTAKLANGAVTSSKLAAGAVTTQKIANGAVTGSKMNLSGVTVPNATNAANAGHASMADNANALNGKSSASFVPYSGTIPSGTTVTGNWYAAPSDPGSTHLGFDEITLPAEATVAIDSAHANMGAGTTNGGDNDSTCTGSNTSPTAPAGKLCFYAGFQVGLSDLSAFASGGDQSHGAAVRVTSDGVAGNHYARGSWAYTAP